MAETTKTLQKRSEVPAERTWRLEDIFATDEAWEKELKQLQNDLPKMKEMQGELTTAENVYKVLQLQDELSERLGKLYTYAHMRYDQDTTNSFYQAMNAKADNVLTLASSLMSFIV